MTSPAKAKQSPTLAAKQTAEKKQTELESLDLDMPGSTEDVPDWLKGIFEEVAHKLVQAAGMQPDAEFTINEHKGPEKVLTVAGLKDPVRIFEKARIDYAYNALRPKPADKTDVRLHPPALGKSDEVNSRCRTGAG